ncbi:MAG: DUF4136 domain-containing protein [Muribaculum sp.]|nr:DUF4136 domain-containing protein [Muribaculum sp.]
MRATLKIAATALIIGLTSCSPYTLIDTQTYNNANLNEYTTFRIYYPTDGADLPPGMDMVTYYNIAAAVREQMMERGYVESPSASMIINLGITVNKELATAPLSSVLPPPPPAPPLIVPVPARPTPPPATPAPAPTSGPSADNPQATQKAPQQQTTSTRGQHFYRPSGVVPAPVAQPYFLYPRYNYWNNAALNNAQVVTGVYREGVLTMDIFNIHTHTALYSASVSTILDNGNTQFRELTGIAKAVDKLFSKFPVPKLPQYQKK